MLSKLYNILHLPTTERLNKLKGILNKATDSDLYFISMLVLLRNSNGTRIIKPSKYSVTTCHNKLLFLYHMVTTDSINTSLSYLSKDEYQVVLGFLKGNTFPLTEVIEHVSRLYTLKQITQYVKSHEKDTLFCELNVEPFRYTIKSNSRCWTTEDHNNNNNNNNNNVAKNIILLNDRMYTYNKDLKDYLLHKANVFPKELMLLNPLYKGSTKGFYVTKYSLSSYTSEFHDFDFVIIKPIDWIVDKNFEIIGVSYEYNNTARRFIGNVGNILSDISIKVYHTERGKFVTARLVT